MAFWLAIFAGGGLGACLRVATVLAIDPRTASAFPWGLLAVNVAGCFAIGAVASFADEAGWLGPTARVFAISGILAGFTTFSSFSLDTLRLAANGQIGFATGNVAASVLFALLGVLAGASFARSLS